MSGIVGLDGKPLSSEATPQGPGLDLRNPVDSLDLLGSVGKSCAIMAHQYNRLAGPKGERNVKVQARDIAGISTQGAMVAEFASNAVAELSFSLAEAEARIAVLMGLMPEDKLEAARKADMDMGTEWENRRTLFSNRVPILLKLKQRLGPALAEAIVGSAPTPEDFEKLKAEAEAAGFNKPELDVNSESGVADPADKIQTQAENSDGTRTEQSPD